MKHTYSFDMTIVAYIFTTLLSREKMKMCFINLCVSEKLVINYGKSANTYINLGQRCILYMYMNNKLHTVNTQYALSVACQHKNKQYYNKCFSGVT